MFQNGAVIKDGEMRLAWTAKCVSTIQFWVDILCSGSQYLTWI